MRGSKPYFPQGTDEDRRQQADIFKGLGKKLETVSINIF